MQLDQAALVLKQHGISATYQRLAVLENLMGRRDHPRAEDIWEDVRHLKPPISKATVYNVLKLFCEKGILKPLFIDQDSTRYDVELYGHGHFHCQRCDRIFNFDAQVEEAPAQGLQGFSISQRDLYYRGICPDCLNASAGSVPHDKSKGGTT